MLAGCAEGKKSFQIPDIPGNYTTNLFIFLIKTLKFFNVFCILWLDLL